jgi:hypothetical protein
VHGSGQRHIPDHKNGLILRSDAKLRPPLRSGSWGCVGWSGTIVLAAEGKHWYIVTIVPAKGDALYEKAMVALAKSIIANLGRG